MYSIKELRHVSFHLLLYRKYGGITPILCDLTRKLRTKQGRFEVNTLPLLEETSQYLPDKRVDIENDVLNRDLIERVLTDESLTVQERRLLQVIYDNTDSSNRDIAILAGLNLPSRKGERPITPTPAYRQLNKAAEFAGVEHVGNHTLGKTFGFWF